MIDQNKLHTREGAHALARRIEAYWAARGWRVHCWVVEAGYDASHRSARYDVRSDLVDGLPPTHQAPGRAA